MSDLKGYIPNKKAEEIRKEIEDKKRRKREREERRQKKEEEENQFPSDFYVPDNDANDSDD